MLQAVWIYDEWLIAQWAKMMSCSVLVGTSHSLQSLKTKKLDPRSKSLHFKTFLSSDFILLSVKEHYQTHFCFVLDWTVQRGSLISLFVLSVLGFSRGSLSSWPCFTLSPDSPPAERGLSPRTVPGLELAHTHISTHTKSSLRLLYFRQKRKEKENLSCTVCLVSSSRDTRSSGQIWSMWWPEI